MYEIHYPVLVNEVIRVLNPKKNEIFLDVTAGYGGHAKAIADKTLNLKSSYLIDRDIEAIEYLKNNIFKNQNINIVKNDFFNASLDLLKKKLSFDIILADIGVSSLHINDQARGFSFRYESPLDMRMDQNQELTAEYVLNNYSEDRLAEILKKYGEEPKAVFIAKEIVARRPLKTTKDLAEICQKAWPKFKSRVNPATRTFQAIRIEVNQELKQLEESLPIWIELLNPGGRLAIISFHSLEDRIIKNYFNNIAGDRYDDNLKLVNKKPIIADQIEIVNNPRARSAKLRAVVKK